MATQYGKSIVLEALASGSHAATNQGEVQLYTTGSGTDAKLALRRAGSQTQRLVATNEYSLTDGNGIADFTFDGTANASIAIDLATNPGMEFSSNKLIAKVDSDALQLGASGIDLKDSISGARTFADHITFTNNIIANGNITGDGSTVLSGVSQLTASYAKIDVLDVNEINSNTVNKTETVLEVVDKLIIAASGSASAAADGGGLQIGGVSGTDAVASVLYEHTGAKLEFNIAGTAYASVDAAGMDVTGDLDVSADLGAATITMTGFSVDADGDTALKSLAVDNSSTIGCDADADIMTLANQSLALANDVDFNVAKAGGLQLAGAAVTSDAGELNLLDGAAADTVVNSKAVIYSSGGNVKATTLQATGLTSNGAIAFSNGSGVFSESANLAWNGSALGVVGSISGSGHMMVGQSLSVDGAALFDGLIAVTGAATLKSTLSVASTSTLTGQVTAAGGVAMSGTINLGSNANSQADNIYFNGKLASDLVPDADNTYDLGGGSDRFAQAHIVALHADTLGQALNASSQNITNVGGFEVDGTAEFSGSLKAASSVLLEGTTDASSKTSGILQVAGGVGIAKKLYVGTDLDVDGTANLDAVDIDGNVQADGTITVGVDDTGYDVKFFGATSGRYFLWDESENAVGIGRAPGSGFAIDVQTGHGNMRADAFVTYSDRTLKTNIQTMDNCLEKVMKLQPTTYDKVATGKSEIGFIAQDVAKVVPEICALDANGEGRGIDYSRMSTLFAGAIKAQQDQIAQLKEIVAKLQK